MLEPDHLRYRQVILPGGTPLPDYGGFCVSEIPALVQDLLVAPDDVSRPLSQWARHRVNRHPNAVVHFLLDGLGMNHWARHLKPETQNGFVRLLTQKGNVTPLTAVFPCSTAPNLTSVHSGDEPITHGLMEWYQYLPAVNMVIKALPFTHAHSKEPEKLSDGYGKVDPTVLYNGSTIYERLRLKGIQSIIFLPGQFVSSSYSSVVLRGADVVGCRDISDLAVQVRKCLENSARPLYIYAYWDTIDGVSHQYGPHSEECLATIRSIGHALETELINGLSWRAASDAVFMLSADHGHIQVDPAETIYLDEFKYLNDCFAHGHRGLQILPWGGHRCMFMRIEAERREEAVRFLASELAGRAVIWNSSAALASGLFGYGDQHPELSERIGNIMILPTGKRMISYRYSNKEPEESRGHHGGLSDDERLIPLALANLPHLCGVEE